jgi:hypothetical protein
MVFSVAKSRSLRGLGLYRSAGRHAAPKGAVPAQRQSPDQEPKEQKPYKALHAASAPRVSERA